MPSDSTIDSIEQFITRWQKSGAAERANFQSFAVDLCDLLGVERPHPSQDIDADNAYVGSSESRQRVRRTYRFETRASVRNSVICGSGCRRGHPRHYCQWGSSLVRDSGGTDCTGRISQMNVLIVKEDVGPKCRKHFRLTNASQEECLVNIHSPSPQCVNDSEFSGAISCGNYCHADRGVLDSHRQSLL